jgi:hypothetical protein
MSAVCDFYGDLVPTSETRKCDKCGAFTWWATKRQKKHGRCLTCVPGLSFAELTEEENTAVILDLLDAFPGSEVHPDWEPPRYPPDTYVGPDAGPCVGCQGRIRRYGGHGQPRCQTCHDQAQCTT